MSTEYSPFAKPTFTAADFARDEPDTGARVERPVRADQPRSYSVEHSFDEPAPADDAPMFAGAPIYARSTRAKSSRAKASGPAMGPMLMVGVPALVLAAGVAYFAMQPREPLLTEQPVALAAAPAAPAPVESAAAEPAAVMPEVPPAAPAASLAPAARVAAPARVARARPAPQAQDASSLAADASATAPAAPIPYSALGQTSAPAPAAAPPSIAVPPMIAPAPAQADPVAADPAPAPDAVLPEPAPVVSEPPL